VKEGGGARREKGVEGHGDEGDGWGRRGGAKCELLHAPRRGLACHFDAAMGSRGDWGKVRVARESEGQNDVQ